MCEHGGIDELNIEGLLDVAEGALRRAVKLPLGGAVDDVALTRLVQRLTAVERIVAGHRSSAIRELDQRHAARGQAAGSTADLLARVLHLAPGEARRETELAEGLASLPDTQRALADGRIGVAQAHVAVKKANEVKDREDGELLVKQIDATAATAGQLMDRNRLARQIDTELAKTDMDVLADRERTAFQRRSLTWTVRDGMHVLHAELDPVGGATVRAMLDSLSRKTDEKDPRSFPQRQADALAHMATLAKANQGNPQGTLQSARVLLITTPDALHGAEGAEPAVLDGHGPVSTELARQLCCDATVNVVTISRDGQALDASPDERLPSARQRAAVIARDKQCVGCGAAVSHCEIHHIVWWTNGGKTVVKNLVLVCWRCHTHIHQLGWQITRDGTGRYRAGPPDLVPLHLDKSIAIHTHAHTG